MPELLIVCRAAIANHGRKTGTDGSLHRGSEGLEGHPRQCCDFCLGIHKPKGFVGIHQPGKDNNKGVLHYALNVDGSFKLPRLRVPSPTSTTGACSDAGRMVAGLRIMAWWPRRE